jgi:MATE family multidrug resistance protein
VNVFANWLLIWGNWGLPEMGLAGAAWGTNIGGAVEVLLLIAFVFEPGVRRMYHVSDWRLRSERLLTLVRIGVPSGLQFVGDVLAWAVFGMLVMAAFGTGAMAANTFAMRFMSLSFMPAFGISAAVTALAGRYIGRGMPDVAAARTALGFRVTAVYMVACGVMFFVFRHELMSIFTDDPEVLRWGAMLLVFVAVFQVFDAMFIVYSGALRGAGDTLVPAIVTAVMCWTLVVGVAYAVAMWLPGLGILGPWTVATTYGALLGVYMLVRFKRGAWRKIRIDRDEPQAFATSPVAEVEAEVASR